jgi:hypothetical protein
MTEVRFIVGFVLLGLASCDPGPQTPQAQAPAENNGLRPQAHEAIRPVNGTIRARQKAFLDRIRQSDPEFQTVQRAILNEQNELGLILNGNVNVDSVPALMKALLTQMSKEFPGQDLVIVAYGPTDPPVLIGTGRFEVRTRQMTYTRGF